MSYTTRDHNHPVLGQTVEVIDPNGHVASIYTGAYAHTRAEQRARELEAIERRNRKAEAEEAD